MSDNQWFANWACYLDRTATGGRGGLVTNDTLRSLDSALSKAAECELPLLMDVTTASVEVSVTAGRLDKCGIIYPDVRLDPPSGPSGAAESSL